MPDVAIQICLQRPLPPSLKKLDSSQRVDKAVALQRGWPTTHEPPPNVSQPTNTQPAPDNTQPAASSTRPAASSGRPARTPVKFGVRYNSFESIDENVLPTTADNTSTLAENKSTAVPASAELVRPSLPARYDSSQRLNKALQK